MYRQDNSDLTFHHAQPEQPVDLLERVEGLSARVNARLIATHNLTSPQAILISALHRHGPELALPELATITEVPVGAVTSVMDRLLVRGLVSRTGHPIHGQWVVAALTPRGLEIAEALDSGRRAMLERVVDGMTDDQLALIASIADRLDDELNRELPTVPDYPGERPLSSPPALRLIRGERQ